jgi:Flp pilus assembly protein TadG
VRLTVTRTRQERGAAAVEFALVVPLLVMLLIGVVTVAIGYSAKVALNNAVREGARLGASAPSSASWADAVTGRVTSAFADPDADAMNVCAKLYKAGVVLPIWSSGSGCGTEPAAPSGVTGCYVKVWAARPVDLNWVFGGATVTMHAQSVAIYDRNESCGTP